MGLSTDIRYRWLLDVVDKGGPDKLLRQDRLLRTSIQSTDTAYGKMATTATSAAAKQTAASARATKAAKDQADANAKLNEDVDRVNKSQIEALSIGAKVAATSDKIVASLTRQAAATRKVADEEGKLAVLRKHATSVSTGVSSGISGIAGAVGTVARGAAFGGAALLGSGVVLADKGLKLGTTVRAGAAGLSGLTGLDPKSATALALIAQAEGVSSRGLATSFATIGKQVTSLLDGLKTEVVKGKLVNVKVPKATEEGFAALHLGPQQVKGLSNNLPGLFDLIYKRSQKLPAAERASVLKTFLGRGAAIGGQIELGGPLQSQLSDVRTQLGGLDPKKLADLHETEIKLKLASDVLQLSFAQTFGAPLISIMDKVAPAIKPIGDALKTAIGVPLKEAKQLLPDVFKGFKAGITGQGVHISNAAGSGRTRRLVAGAGERPRQQQTELQKIGETVGDVLHEVGKGAVKYGGELLDALKPAVPFLENVLLPALKDIGAGVVEAFKLAVPLLHAFAVVLGDLGTVAKPLAPLFSVLGLAVGVGFAPKIVGLLTDIPKLGGVFRLLALPLTIAQKGLGIVAKGGAAVISNFGLVRGAASSTGSILSKFAGVAKTAGGKIASVLDSALGGVPGRWATYGQVAGKALVQKISSFSGRLADAAKKLAGDFSSVFIGAGEGTGEAAGKDVASGLGSSGVKDALKVVGLSLGRLVGVGITAGIAYEIYTHRQEIAEKLKEIANPASHGKKEGINSAGGKAKPGSGFEEGLQKIIGLFRGGGWVGYGGGGMVDAMVSPGEMVATSMGSYMVPGVPTAADSVHMQLPVGAAVLTSDGQRMAAEGQPLGQILATQRPHFAKGGVVVGRVSTFGPPSEGAGTTASGASSATAGVAIRPGSTWQSGKPFLGDLWQIQIGSHSGRLKQIDLGPNQSTGRRIDVTGAGARQLGIDPSRFPTDSTGTATLLSGKAGSSVTIPVTLGAARREGLVADALNKGIEAGLAGEGPQTSAKTIAEALGTVTQSVTLPKSNQPKGLSDPTAKWNPRRLKIASWIVPYLSYGASHGWPGTATSGYRSKAEQTRIWNSGVRPAARPGTSNHEGTAYPSGAVDVTSAATLSKVLMGAPPPHLLQWAGSKDPVHFSHPHNGGYRRGGIVGYRSGGRVPLSGAVSRLEGSATSTAGYEAALRHLDNLLAGYTVSRLEQIRRTFVTQASKPGSAALRRSFQAAISAIDFQVGVQIGSYGREVAQRSAAVQRGGSALERFEQVHGISSGSARGLELTTKGDVTAEGALRGNVARATAALKIAQRTRNKNAIQEASEKLVAAQEELSSQVAKTVEDGRNQLRQASTEIAEHAQALLGGAERQITGLENGERQAGTAGTPAALQAKAAAIQSTLLPALQASMAALQGQMQVGISTGESQTELDALIGQVQEAGNAIGSAMAESAELIREAAENAAAEVVETATHGVTLAELGQSRLEIEQRISGSYEGGGEQRADYIRKVLVPALTSELGALVSEQQVAQADGNAKLAQQIAEAIFGKENDIKQQQLAALEAIDDNTTPKPGGSVAFQNNGETLTDRLVWAGDGL